MTAKIKDIGNKILNPKNRTKLPEHTLEETIQVSITFIKYKKIRK